MIYLLSGSLPWEMKKRSDFPSMKEFYVHVRHLKQTLTPTDICDHRAIEIGLEFLLKKAYTFDFYERPSY